VLLHRTSESGYESVDRDDLECLHRFFATVDFNNLVNTVSLFDNDNIGETVCSTFDQYYRTVQYHFMSVEHDIGELYSLESVSLLQCCDYCICDDHGCF